MFPSPLFAAHGQSCPGAPRVPPELPGNNSVSWPTSATSAVPGQLPGAVGRPPIGLPMLRFQLAAEPRRTDATGIAHLSPLPGISYDKYDADYESDDSSDLGSAKGKAPISFKRTEFSLTQFPTRMGQRNSSTFNKWKKVWVAGFLEKKHRSIIHGQNSLKQLQDGPLHFEMAVKYFFGTIETWLPLEIVENAERIQQ